MKWIKHYTDAHTNLKFQNLLKEYGLFGYGMWWVCCELVGKSGKHFKLTPNKWWKQKILEVSKWTEKDLDKFLGVLADSNLISKKLLNKGYLAIPKMTDYADEYTEQKGRKSRQDRDNVGPEEIRRDKIRLDKIREEEINKTPPPFKKKPYFKGMEMRKKDDKWWVIPKGGGKWLEFAGSEKDITYK